MQLPETPQEFAWDGIGILVVGGIVGFFLRDAGVLSDSAAHTSSGIVLWATAIIGGGLLVIAAIAKAVQVGVRSSRD